jgi:hypothetical protein
MESRIVAISLPHISHAEVERMYADGSYVLLQLPRVDSMTPNASSRMVSVSSDNPDNNVFVMKWKNHNGITIATDNCSMYSGNTSHIKCNYCHDVITGDSTSIEVAKIVDSRGNIISVETYLSFCHERCQRGYIDDKIFRGSAREGGMDWRKIKADLLSSYYVKHRKYLPGANDPLLLITNGGSLTKAEWNDINYIYIPTNCYTTSTVACAIKRNYLKTKVCR